MRQLVAVDTVTNSVDCVDDTVDFVASVYGAKATRSTLSTLNKVNCVEFNFVASVLGLRMLKFQSYQSKVHKS